MRLPKGWIVAPDDAYSSQVIGMYQWGTDFMVVASGVYYPTNCWYCGGYGSSALRNTNGLYWPANCNMRILIVYAGCQEGWGRDACLTSFYSVESRPSSPIFYGPSNASILENMERMGDLNLTYVLSPTSVDDNSWNIPDFHFPFCIEGNNFQSAVYISSNAYLTFGSPSSNYMGLSASNPPVPTLFVGGGDASAQLIVGSSITEDDMQAYLIRFEGTSSTSGTPGQPNLIFEVTFFANNTIRVAVGMQNLNFSTMYMLSDGMGSSLLSYAVHANAAVLVFSTRESVSARFLDAACIPCNNSIPLNARYSPFVATRGGVCEWMCSPGFYKEGKACMKCSNKPSRSIYVNDKCGWTCDLGFYKSSGQCIPCTNIPKNAVFLSAGVEEDSDSCGWLEVVQEGANVYTTLTGGPNAQYSSVDCVADSREYLPVPDGWVLAPDDEVSVNVTAKYSWGALRLVLSSGSSYFTRSALMFEGNNYYFMPYYFDEPGAFYGSNNLDLVEGKYYRSADCHARLLLLASFCGTGYKQNPPPGATPLNRSDCIPCTNPIPAGAEYLLSPDPRADQSCGWSCKTGYYWTGSMCALCTGKPPSSVYIGTGVNGKAESCPWKCVTGYQEEDGQRCKPCLSSLLPENALWQGPGCSWECNFGFRLSGDFCEDISVGFNGQRYATLEGRSPHDSSVCQRESFRRIPDGWNIAPNNQDSVTVATRYAWGSNQAVLADGSGWSTVYGGQCCWAELLTYQDMYLPQDSCGTILLVQEDCLVGYHRDTNLSQCVSCTNYKPEFSEYTSSGSPSFKNNCRWQCNRGYFLDSENSDCLPCSGAPENSIYTLRNGASCEWLCRVGFVLRDGACQPCDTILPEFAFFVVTASETATCAWECRFGFLKQNGRCVGIEYGGRYYTTLNGRGPNDRMICMYNPFLPIPDGWMIASDNIDSQQVTWRYSWGSCRLVYSDLTRWYTAGCSSSSSPQQCCTGSLETYNNMWRSTDCSESILLVSIDCAAGYTKQISDCVPCTNTIPANALYAAEYDDEELLVSTCAFKCNAGFMRAGSSCTPCDTSLLAGHAQFIEMTRRSDPRYDCLWECSAGWYYQASKG
eukprot:757771-Hanusia_phi.AAC.5